MKAASITSAPSTWCRTCTPSIRTSLRSSLKFSTGNVYNADLVEKSVEAMTIEAAKHGYAFANVRPRGDRDFQKKIINLTFVVEEGTRAYIERINIHGNTRTRDYVIRREFDIGEGDAYNRALIDRAERRLKNLGYFKTVKITNEPGSAPDRVVINVNVEEQVDRRILHRRRLLHRRRFPRRGQRRRPQPDGPRPIRQGVGELRPVFARLLRCRFVEPYLLGYRMAGGIDLFARQSLADIIRFLQHANDRHQSAPRLCAVGRTLVPAALFDLPAEDHAAGSVQ